MRYPPLMIAVFFALILFQPILAKASDTQHSLIDLSVNNDPTRGWVNLVFDDYNNTPSIQRVEQSFPNRILITLLNTSLGSDLREGLFYETLFTTSERAIQKIIIRENKQPQSVILSLYIDEKVDSRIIEKGANIAVLELSSEGFADVSEGRMFADADEEKSAAQHLDEIISSKVKGQLESAQDDIDLQIKALEDILHEIERSNQSSSQKRSLNEKYRIQAGDKLDISIIGEPDFSKNVAVRPDGYITFPLLGDVIAEGLAPEELAMIMKTRLMAVYFNYDISLTVTVSETVPSKVYLLGSFLQAGPMQYRKGMTLLDVVGRFDKKDVDLTKVSVIRSGSGRIEVNLADILKGDISKNVELMPNDYVVMTSRELLRVMVLGKVRVPGMYEMKDDSRLYDSIASAGGVAPRCDIRHIMILRENNGEQERIEVDLRKFEEELDLSQNIKLNDRDIIFIPEVNRTDWDKLLGLLQRVGATVYDFDLVSRERL